MKKVQILTSDEAALLIEDGMTVSTRGASSAQDRRKTLPISMRQDRETRTAAEPTIWHMKA